MMAWLDSIPLWGYVASGAFFVAVGIVFDQLNKRRELREAAKMEQLD